VRTRFKAAAAAVLAASVLVVAASGDDDESGADTAATQAGAGASLTIADKGFAESRIVAEAYAQALEAQGFDAELTSLASTEIADKAITGGSIDVYPEYVGTAYLNVLGLAPEDAPADAADQFTLVADGYTPRGLTSLPPAPFNNGNEVACTQEAVDQYDITTLSDLGEASANLVYSANAEHLTRPDGLPLLRSQYGVDFKDIRTVDISLRYKPIEDGDADCVYAFGTDPLLGKLPLVVLEDDKGTFTGGVSFQTFPVVNTEWIDSLSPEARTAFTATLASVNEALTAETIRPLIARVEIDKEDPDAVAADFLTAAGITAR
jgi:osmoprotectant transport system substrate-binding protein